MKSSHSSKALALIAILFATNTNAVIIEGTFQGTVMFDDEYRDSMWWGSWGEDISGTPGSGSFWYDTDKAPANTSMYETSSQFRSSTNEWMDLGFVIGGKTINISDVGANRVAAHRLK